MASGAGSVSGVSYSLEIQSEGNEWYRTNSYGVTVRNNSAEEIAAWSVTIPITSGTAKSVTSYNGWFATAYLKGNSVVLEPGQGGVLAPGGEGDIQIAVGYDGDHLTLG